MKKKFFTTALASIVVMITAVFGVLFMPKTATTPEQVKLASFCKTLFAYQQSTYNFAHGN